MKFIATLSIAALSIQAMALDRFAEVDGNQQDYSRETSVQQPKQIPLSEIKGVSMNENGLQFQVKDPNVKNAGLLEYLSTSGICVGVEIALSIGFDFGVGEGDLIRKWVKEYADRPDAASNHGDIYLCLSNSGLGVVDMTHKMRYMGLRASGTSAASVLIAVGYDPNTNASKMIGKNGSRKKMEVNLYGPQLSVGLGKMPGASAMCGVESESKGLLCRATLGTGIGMGLTLGYKTESSLNF